MAKNTGAGNKRVATKHIRDGIKSNYKKQCKCAVCDTEEDLELHHYTTISILLKKYSKERQIPINTDEEVLAMRDAFYEEYWHELVEYTVTLCASHHKLLHRTYGREPSLSTAGKQEIWVQKIRDKLMGKDPLTLTTTVEDSTVRGFSRFVDSEFTSSDRFSRHI
jgi:hypothetical protein